MMAGIPSETLLLLLLSLLLQLSCHAVAVVFTLVQTKQIRINIHKRNNKKTQYKQYKSRKIQVHILKKTPTHYKTHTYTHPHIHTHPHITNPPVTHTQPTHYKTLTYTHPHITKPTRTHTHI